MPETPPKRRQPGIDWDFVDGYHSELKLAEGIEARAFFCPFTCEDTYGERNELCQAHIIPQSVKPPKAGQVPRMTVPQRSDVDGYFGKTLDKAFARLLNHAKGRNDILKAAVSGVVFASDRSAEEAFPAFPATGKDLASPDRKFALVEFRPDGADQSLKLKIIGEPQKVEKLAASGKFAINLQTSLLNPEGPAAHAAWVRAAYLAFFRLAPAFAVSNPCGPFLRGPFSRFFRDRADVQDAHRYFRRFVGAMRFIVEQRHQPAWPLDSVRDRTVIFHTVRSPMAEQGAIPFAVSVLFDFGGAPGIVALPWCGGPQQVGHALDLYDRFLAGGTGGVPNQFMSVARLEGSRWSIDRPNLPPAERVVRYRVAARQAPPDELPDA